MSVARIGWYAERDGAMQDLVAPQLESPQGEKLTVALELRERLVALEAKLGL